MKTVIFIALACILIVPLETMAKGGGGGARGGAALSSVSSSRSTSTISTSRTTTPTTTAPKVSTKPTTSTKTVDSVSKTTSTGKKTTRKASVVDETYKPTFRGGYTPPTGSTVQYVDRSTSFVDYLPWIYLFSKDSRERVNTQEAVVTEPDGTERTVVEEEGGDGLLVLNWIIMIALAGGLIYGIMWLVNYYSSRKAYV